MNPICNELPYKTFIDLKKSSDTKANYASDLGALRDWMRKNDKGKEVFEITRADLLEYFMAVQKRGVSDMSVKRYTTSIKSFFKFLESDDKSIYYREKDPTKILDQLSLKSSKTRRRALDPSQREVVLDKLIWDDTIREWQVSLAVFIAFKTGLRRFEIAKLAWKDINLATNKLFVLGKGSKEAVLNITPELHDKLADYKLLTSKIDTKWVFFNRETPEVHLDKTNIARCFRIVKKRCGFSEDIKFSTHDGRRIFCTILFEKGVKPEIGKKASRHDSVDMLLRYVRIDDELVQGEVNRAIG